MLLHIMYFTLKKFLGEMTNIQVSIQKDLSYHYLTPFTFNFGINVSF